MGRAAAAALVLAAVPAAALGQPAPAGDADIAHLVAMYEKVSVPASSVLVEDVRLAAGHLTLVLKSGSAAPVVSGSKVVGLFFEGQGAIEYRSEDPVEFPVMAFNLRKASSLTAERSDKALTVRDGFQRVLWLAAGRALPALPGGAELWNAGESRLLASAAVRPSLEASFQRHREKFRRARGGPTSHLFALVRGNGSTAPVVVAEIEGGKEDLRYVDDEAEDRSERLTLLRRPETSDAEMRRQLYAVTISEQPIGRDRRDVMQAPFLLTDVRVELSASDGKDASLTVIETVVPQERPRTVFAFSLHSTVYDVIGSGSLSPRIYRLKSVADAAGKALSFHHWNGEVLVGLREPAPPGQPVRLTFEITGDFLIRPGGDNYWELGAEPWFPQPDLSGQYYTFHAAVKVKKPFFPFASGRTLARRTEGDTNILETEIDKPVQFAVVLAGKYEWKEETRNGVTIRVASYAGRNERAMKQLTELAFGIIAFYENFLGPFPFPEFNILEINEYGFGQAPPGVMFITKEAFNPLLGEANQFFSQGVNERFAHEIAHQYWGHVVKMPSIEEQWLTESFAEYSAAIFLKAFKGQSTYTGLVRHWKTRAKSASDASPIPLANRVSVPGDRYVQFTIQTGLIYDQGALLLAALHKELGDQMFLTALKSFQKSLRWKFGSTKLFAGLLEFLTKKDYMPFFEKYYWGTAPAP
jgi:hypothetical protein